MADAAAPKRTSKLDSLSANERKELIGRLYHVCPGCCATGNDSAVCQELKLATVGGQFLSMAEEAIKQK